jgi:energy-coupling factor transporter transmembrane protein EcfT
MSAAEKNGWRYLKSVLFYISIFAGVKIIFALIQGDGKKVAESLVLFVSLAVVIGIPAFLIGIMKGPEKPGKVDDEANVILNSTDSSSTTSSRESVGNQTTVCELNKIPNNVVEHKPNPSVTSNTISNEVNKVVNNEENLSSLEPLESDQTQIDSGIFYHLRQLYFWRSVTGSMLLFSLFSIMIFRENGEPVGVFDIVFKFLVTFISAAVATALVVLFFTEKIKKIYIKIFLYILWLLVAVNLTYQWSEGGLNRMADKHHFDLNGARKAGYKDEEIADHLSSLEKKGKTSKANKFDDLYIDDKSKMASESESIPFDGLFVKKPSGEIIAVTSDQLSYIRNNYPDRKHMSDDKLVIWMSENGHKFSSFSPIPDDSQETKKSSPNDSQGLFQKTK